MTAPTLVIPPEKPVDVAALAFRLHEDVRALVGTIRTAFLELGTRLRLINDFSLYRELGHETFESYLADPEVQCDLRRTEIYRLIRAARVFVPSVGQPPLPVEAVAALGITKADLLAPAVARADEDERAELLAVARSLSVRDLRSALRERASARTRVSAGCQQSPDPDPEAEPDEIERTARRLRALVDRLMLDPPGGILRQIEETARTARARLEASVTE